MFRTWGGKRKRAGRKQVNARKSQPHRVRQALSAVQAGHVTVRIAPHVGNVRRRNAYQAIRRALQTALGRCDFRVVHVSIQRTHVHFLVEAGDQFALAKGMQGLLISAARRLNAKLGRRGQVFVDRYHVEIIDSPRQARNALAYVLNNWRRHGEHLREPAHTWRIDPYSSAIAFRGFIDRPEHWELPASYERLPVCMPQTWLLRVGWARHGPIGIDELPGPEKIRHEIATTRAIAS